MKTYVRYDEETGEIKSTTTSVRVPDISAQVGIKQLEVAPDTDLHKKMINPQNKKIVDRVFTDYELLRQAYSIKDIVTIASDPAEWAKFQVEINAHEIRDGRVKKKDLIPLEE